MIFTEPMPFVEALDYLRAQSLLPTTGTTRDLQKLEPAIKRRALFSATVASAEHLARIREGIAAVVSGETDQATARLGIKSLLTEMGYAADPQQAGGLRDLASTRRTDLQIETNVAVARGAGWHEQGQQPEILDAFPAQELYRATNPNGGEAAGRNWPGRWADAGGSFYDGRMVALKDDRVWERLGDPGLFPDGLGNPWPPFAFNSGMRVRDIARAEAEGMGLLDPADVVLPDPLDLAADLAAPPLLREQWLREAIADSGVGRFDERGALVFTGGGGT